MAVQSETNQDVIHCATGDIDSMQRPGGIRGNIPLGREQHVVGSVGVAFIGHPVVRIPMGWPTGHMYGDSALVLSWPWE